MSSCPACSYTGSEHGVKVHFGRSHDGTLARTADCEVCGREFKVTDGRDNARHCSMLCKKVTESNCETRQGLARARHTRCKNCDEWFTTPGSDPSVFCEPDCQQKWRDDTGFMRGEEHPRYKYGVRDINLPRSLRQKVRARDDYCCQRCELTQKQSLEQYGCKLHVHHIVPRRQFETQEEANKMNNLTSLCPKCHGIVENEQTGV